MRRLKILFTVVLLLLNSVSCTKASSQENTITNDSVIDLTSNTADPSTTPEIKGTSFSDESFMDAHVITIGTGTPQHSTTKASASTAVYMNGKYYIIDCGDGSYANMSANDFDFKSVDGLILTHHHIDHTGDFSEIYVKSAMTNIEPIQVIGPPRTGLFVDLINQVYLDDILYRKLNTTKNLDRIDKDIYQNHSIVTEIIGEDSITVNGITITTAEMSHTMYNLAYRFDSNGASIVVSGDTSYDEDLITLAKNADILVIDGTLYSKKNNISNKQAQSNSNVTTTETATPTTIEPFYDYGGDFEVDSHLAFDDMVTIAKEANVKTLVITHYNDASDERIDISVTEIQKIFKGNVFYATDMMHVNIDGTLTDNEQTATEEPSNQIIQELTYPIVDTNQKDFYSDTALISEPTSNEAFYGQDASYTMNPPTYTDNTDGTITDHITELMWAQDMGEKMSYNEAVAYAKNATLGGYDDWRIPTIKELYSLIQFDGRVMGATATSDLFIDTDFFIQPLGDTSKGEREIDGQTWSSTKYVGKTMNSNETVFGVNFIDGRIKGYPMTNKRSKTDNEMYFRLVRGNAEYGENNYVDNGDGTITDLATGLTWQQSDSQSGMDWEDALSYAENLELAGHNDWRLPNAKELQSIVDYNRSLQTTNSPAIDPLFNVSEIKDPYGHMNYPYYWSSTTHLDGKNPYSNGVYIAFGEALGEMNGKLMDVHGAGAQRSDPKSGNDSDYPKAVGPQGDIRIVYNYVRCVRTTN